MPLEVAILLTNTDRSTFASSHPNDGEKVASAMRVLRPDWSYRVWRAMDGELPPDLSKLGAVVITGSPAGVNDGEPWIEASLKFVREAHALRVPTVGLCFGHQLIAKALGGRVERAARWGLGLGELNLVQKKSWMIPSKECLSLFAIHQDQVVALPPGASLLGGSDFCPNGFYSVGDHMLGVQFHPELGRPFVRALLNERGAKFPPEALAAAQTDIEQEVDADLFFRWMVNFIESSKTP